MSPNVRLQLTFTPFKPPPAKGIEMTHYEPSSPMSLSRVTPLAPSLKMNPSQTDTWAHPYDISLSGDSLLLDESATHADRQGTGEHPLVSLNKITLPSIWSTLQNHPHPPLYGLVSVRSPEDGLGVVENLQEVMKTLRFIS